MSAHKSIDKICAVIIALTLVIAVVFCNSKALGIETTARAMGYENRIFDQSKVHTIDIVINDWDGFLETCEQEEYSACNLVIDGEAVKNVGIRAKGNTSLSSVKNMNSSRYSFKIEFDQYENGKTYHGLDKLCLNNIIQDNTYMKDYLAYTLMYDLGVDAPLCSYAYLTVNGEDWGLYLAVEAIEESFLERNYGTNYGDLYKPDSMSFGGGRGNGRDFSMTDFMDENSTDESGADAGSSATQQLPGGNMPDFGGNMPDFSNGEMPEDFDPSEMFGGGGMGGFGGGGFGGGMGSSDVKLQYVDDDPDSYSNIFGNAKTDVTTADKNRLISALKSLSTQEDIESTVDVDEVLRYFVVHNFLCNGDSYTGQMIHNYYLYEKDGQLSMIPWDYNLAYGSFQGSNASSSVNSPIDTPVSGDMSDRPMVAWIFSSNEYTEQYHELFSQFISSVDFTSLIEETAALIDSYVEKDPTKFCTYEEFQTGVKAIKQFCELRAESVSGQLDGTIPSTSDGQSADSSALVDTGDLDLSDMGSMGGGMGGGGFGGGNMPDFNGGGFGGSFGSGFNGTADDSTEDTQSGDSHDIQPYDGNTSGRPSGKQGGRGKSAGTSAVSATNMANVQPPNGGGQMPDFGGGQMPDFGNGEAPDFGNGQMPDFGNGQAPDFGNGQMPDFGNGEAPDFGNGQMPDFGGNTQSDSDEDSAEVSQPATDTANAPAERGSDRSGSRPAMGTMPSMNSTSSESNTTAYILLGVSAAVLLFGLIFAKKYRR